jgi:hypothetical protein
MDDRLAEMFFDPQLSELDRNDLCHCFQLRNYLADKRSTMGSVDVCFRVSIILCDNECEDPIHRSRYLGQDYDDYRQTKQNE